MSLMNKPEMIEGAVVPATGVMTEVISIPLSAAFATLQINITNDSENVGSIRIYRSKADNTAAVQRSELIEAGDTIAAKGRYTNFGLLLSPGSRIYVQATIPDLVVSATALVQLA